jgi:hypothetical protein
MRMKIRSVYGSIVHVDKVALDWQRIRMSLRRFLAMLFAVAMIFAPLGMPAGRAIAAPMASHHDKMAMPDHCAAKPDQHKPSKAIDHGCCAAMCLGITMSPALPDEQPAYPRIALRPAVDQFHRGFLGEIATPPPRLA